MVSFRYHLVSIIGIFLALALGIVVGTTALNGPITTDLRHQVDSLKGDRAALATQVKALNARVGDADQFAANFANRLVADTLTDQGVLIIGMPGANAAVENNLKTGIANAGGKLSGQLDFTTDYIDQRRASDITALATNGKQPSGLTLPETSDAAQLGGALLSYVLMGHGQPTDVQAVLASFSSLHMINGASATPTPTLNVIVVGTGPMSTGSYAAHAELALVSALQHAGGHVVVAGDSSSATAAGLVAEVRSSSGPKTTVSTVDNADAATGQVSTILALSDVINSTVGHYGAGNGASSGLFPKTSSN